MKTALMFLLLTVILVSLAASFVASAVQATITAH